jgi:hypothetical protein
MYTIILLATANTYWQSILILILTIFLSIIGMMAAISEWKYITNYQSLKPDSGIDYVKWYKKWEHKSRNRNLKG